MAWDDSLDLQEWHVLALPPPPKKTPRIRSLQIGSEPPHALL